MAKSLGRIGTHHHHNRLSHFNRMDRGPRPRCHPHKVDIHAASTTIQQRSVSTYTYDWYDHTIVALLVANSTVIILAADTRATDGTMVSCPDKNCEKLHSLASNVGCAGAGAGTSADVNALVRKTKFKFWKMWWCWQQWHRNRNYKLHRRRRRQQQKCQWGR